MTPEIIAADPAWPYTKAKTSVLSAAAAVIREDGPRAATLKNVASRAGITEPAIFRHFEGIDGLFCGLFDTVERIYDRVAASFQTEERGVARLRSGVLETVEVFAAARDFAYVMLHAEQIFRGYPDLKRRLSELRRRDRETAMACLLEARERGEIREDVDLDSVATAVVGMVFMTVSAWIESGYAFDLRAAGALRWADAERFIAPPR